MAVGYQQYKSIEIEEREGGRERERGGGRGREGGREHYNDNTAIKWNSHCPLTYDRKQITL